jgi:hypothetical protein
MTGDVFFSGFLTPVKTEGLVVKNGSKIRLKCVSGIPTPVSSTIMTAWWVEVSGRAEIRICSGGFSMAEDQSRNDFFPNIQIKSPPHVLSCHLPLLNKMLNFQNIGSQISLFNGKSVRTYPTRNISNIPGWKHFDNPNQT